METNTTPMTETTETAPPETYREHALRQMGEYAKSVNYGLDDEE